MKLLAHRFLLSQKQAECFCHLKVTVFVFLIRALANYFLEIHDTLFDVLFGASNPAGPGGVRF